MVHDPISVLDALMIALSGIVIVFIMLALLWGVIAVISRDGRARKAHRASGFGQCSGSGGCGSGSSTCTGTGSAGQAGRRQRGGGGLRYGYCQPRNGHSARSACI